jgi:hypothetical protein
LFCLEESNIHLGIFNKDRPSEHNTCCVLVHHGTTYYAKIDHPLHIIKNVHTNGPKLNTLYVPIGKLYPRADFAGVLINLNVDKAIQRGHAALNLTDAFLQFNQHKQKLGPWTGANRNIHFLTLKRRQVQKNLDILTADLYQAHEQYRLPGTQ